MSVYEKMTALANILRSKTGLTEPLGIDDMIAAAANIPSLDNLIDGTCTEITSQAESIKSYMFYEFTNLITANFPLATNVGTYAFYYSSNLTTVTLPEATTIGSYAFSGCSNLKSIKLPHVSKINSMTFASCSNLKTVDLGICNSIGNYAFSTCPRLTAVVLRSSSVCTLTYTNAFTNCYHILGTTNNTYNPNGLKDGYFYVPRSLINSYKSASNWATYSS